MTNAPRRALRRLARPVTRTVTLLLTAALALGTTASAYGYEQGVDVSKWQHGTSLDWSKVKADGVDFAFIKATEDTNYTNPYFAGDWAATTKLGIYRGAYHFARPKVGTAGAQARYFVSVAGKAGASGDLPPVLDLESSGGLTRAELRTWVRNWLVTVQDLTGRTPIIYCSPSFWNSYVADTTFTDYPLWIAHYTTASQPTLPGGWTTWTFWQNTSSGKVTGISGYVDEDRFNGSLAQLKVLANVTAAPSPVATTTTAAPRSATTRTGSTMAFTGAVTTSSGASAGQTVALARRLPGSTDWVRVTTAITAADGSFTVSGVVDQAASYRVRALGDTVHLESTSPTMAIAISGPTTTVATQSAPSVLAGGSVTLSGSVSTATGPSVGQTVALARALPGGSWERVTTAVTDSNGAFSVPVVVDQAASYRFHALSDPDHLESYSPPLDVALIQPTTTTVTPSATAAYAGGKVTFAGSVATADTVTPVAGRTVVLSRRLAGSSSWVALTTAVTDTSGTFAVPAVVEQSAAYRVRALGDATYAASTSPTSSVALIPPAATSLDLHTATTTPRRGTPITLYGHLLTTDSAGHTTPLASGWVSLWRRQVGSSTWTQVSGYRSLSTGWWQVGVKPWKDVVFQARYIGGARYQPARSARLAVYPR
ncbi:MAG: GH25 family lysozyme [Nocardioidaceae bacterium]